MFDTESFLNNYITTAIYFYFANIVETDLIFLYYYVSLETVKSNLCPLQVMFLQMEIYKSRYTIITLLLQIVFRKNIVKGREFSSFCFNICNETVSYQ